MGYSHGKHWSVDVIEKQLKEMIDTLGMTTFPSHSEMDAFYGFDGLSGRVSKTGGTKYWAEKFGLPIKQTESSFGYKYEQQAIKDIFDHVGYEAVQTKPRYPYDLIVKKHIKVDVKASRLKEIRGNYYNGFELAKRDPTCDIYMLYCLKKDGKLTKTIIIPSCVTSGQRYIAVGEKSKWDCYMDNWNLFRKYSDFYESMIGGQHGA